MRSLGWALLQYDYCPYKKEKLGHRHARKGEHHMKMKAEIRLMPLQAKQDQRLPANHRKLRERHGTDSPSQPLEGTNPRIPWFQTFRLQNCERMNFCHLSHPVCGSCYGSSSKLIPGGEGGGGRLDWMPPKPRHT